MNHETIAVVGLVIVEVVDTDLDLLSVFQPSGTTDTPVNETNRGLSTFSVIVRLYTRIRNEFGICA